MTQSLKFYPVSVVLAMVGLFFASINIACSDNSPQQALAAKFGASVKPEKAVKPWQLEGDFDGDKKPDTLFVVKTSGLVGDLPPAIRAANIFDGKLLSKSHSLVRKDNISLAITMSNKKAVGYLIVDTNHPSILAEMFAGGLTVLGKKETEQVKKDYELKSKGNLIVIPTGAGIDTYLFWNGERFEYYEPEEMP